MHFIKSSSNENSFELNLELEYVNQEIHHENNLFLRKTQKKHSYSVPCEVFRQGFSGLGAIIKYLKEEENLTYSQISKAINRDQRTVWTTYSKVKTKVPEQLKKFSKKEKRSFSTNILKNRDLSILENVSVYLKESGLTLKEISNELGRDSKTIWTALNRAKKKINQCEVRP